MKVFLSAVALLALPSLGSATPNPVGKWKGHLHIDLSNMTPDQKRQAASYLDSVNKLRVTLTFKANHTFTALVENALSPSERTRSGTWATAGDKVILHDSTMEGPGQTFSMSKDGKSMSFRLPRRTAGRSELVLKR